MPKPAPNSSPATTTPPAPSRSKRIPPENSRYPTQPGTRATIDQRRAAAAAAANSASPKSTAPKGISASPNAPNTKTPTKLKGSGGKEVPDSEWAGEGGDDEVGNQPSGNAEVVERLKRLEEKVKKLEDEGEKMRCELTDLRDRVEEGEFAARMLEGKVKEVETMREETETLKTEIDREREEREKIGKEMKAVRKEVEEKVDGMKKIQENGSQPRSQSGGSQEVRRKTKYIVITDSNGQGATEASIKTHIPKSERDQYDIEIAVAYTTEEAEQKLERRLIDVRDAVVILDNLTNDVRGSRGRRPANPDELIRRVHKLHQRARTEGAKAIITCQIKPMRTLDVTPFNDRLDKFLSARGDFGCLTQIQMDFLKPDGYHVLPGCGSIIDRTYACAIRGISVPCPTPRDGFLPEHLRREWETEWPRVGEGHQLNHGGRC